jgi:AraC-like DNA-binding protein
MSVRYLHRLFEDAGASVRATILARRLDRCRDALAGSPRRSISEIAFAWGFNDAAHFSRVFKARFGGSPRDLRAAA